MNQRQLVTYIENKNKKANVFHTPDGYEVDLIQNKQVLETRKAYAYSLHYAEDIAYNWISGIIKI
jgi:hypothetical protein|tara:strand:- start:1512 stop:1706 length:195 start_codon:yes stop_codon:yes gene_type:complete